MGTVKTATMHGLPSEILLYLLQFVDDASLCVLVKTCRRFHSLLLPSIKNGKLGGGLQGLVRIYEDAIKSRDEQRMAFLVANVGLLGCSAEIEKLARLGDYMSVMWFSHWKKPTQDLANYCLRRAMCVNATYMALTTGERDDIRRLLYQRME